MKSVVFQGSVVYVISLVDNSLPFEWFFKALKNEDVKFSVVFLHPARPHLMLKLEALGIKAVWLPYTGKRDLPATIFRLWKYFRTEKPQVVHTHLFDACAAGLPAATMAGVPLKVHTRHHASQHHVYHPHAVKYDRIINRMSDKIVAISENIRDILVIQESVPADKVQVVHHGFDIGYFGNVPSVRVETLRRKYHIPPEAVVVGMISRFTIWKGVQYVIHAFKSYLLENPTSVLLLANAKGDYSNTIKSILSSELPETSYRLVDFEPDTPALFALFDVFVHVPVNDHAEAFGQVYVEALLSRCPSVFTLSGIATELIVDNQNAFVVPFNDSDAISRRISYIMHHKSEVQRVVQRGYEDACRLFGVEVMVGKTLKVYAG